jgi:hypothetical protein
MARRPPRCSCSLCVATGPSEAAWPGAPTAPQGSSAPLILLVWLNRDSPCFGPTPGARGAFRQACMHASVHALRCAKYEIRTTNCAPHMRLTIVHALHAQQCRAGLKLLQRYVRQHLGWHVALETTQLGRPLPQTQRNRGFTAYVGSFGFTHQRRPYDRPPNGSGAPPTIPRPSPNRFAALPMEDSIDTDGDTSSTDDRGTNDVTCSAQGPAVVSDSAVNTEALVHISSVTPASSPATRLDTWNVNSLETRDSLSRLVALSHFMHHNGVGVLAVQETRIRPQNPLAAAAGLKYYGDEPILQSNTSGRYCRGTGFLVRDDHHASFTYLGARCPLLQGYGAVWARWPWDGLKLSHAHYAPGFKSRSRRAPPLVFYTSCSVGCVWGFW